MSKASNYQALRIKILKKMLESGKPITIIELRRGYRPHKDSTCEIYVPLPEYGFALKTSKELT